MIWEILKQGVIEGNSTTIDSDDIPSNVDNGDGQAKVRLECFGKTPANFNNGRLINK